MTDFGICGDTSAYLPEFWAGYYSSPLIEGCNGRGTCVSPGICDCDPNWTGLADFINLEGISCVVQNNAVKSLWAVNFVFIAVTLLRTRENIWAKREQHLQMVELRRSQGRKYGVLDNRGWAAIVSWVFVCAPATLILGILKMATNNERVGLTPGMTILFSIAKLGFYLTAYFYQPGLLATILEGSKARASLVRIAQIWGKINLVISLSVGFMPLITLIFGDSSGRDSVAQGVYFGYMGGSVLSMLVFGSQAFLIQHRFNQIMKSEVAGKSERNLEIQKNLNDFQRSTAIQATVQGLIYGLYFWFPFMIGTHDYFLPISWLAFGLLYRKLANSTISTKKIDRSTTDGSSREGSRDASFSAIGNAAGASTQINTNVGQTKFDSSFAEKAQSFVEDLPESQKTDDDGYV